MPNHLTGDFEAILQVSGRTLNRLLASMHQNAGSGKNLPSFPHSSFIRLGKAGQIGGVRGLARVQSGTPHIELLHGVQDRFRISVWIRAHYLPDSASTPLPEFIHGEVSAVYRAREEWHERQGMLLHTEVQPESVSFTSAGPDRSADAQITEQVVEALRTQFAMEPHPLESVFQNRQLRSLLAPGGASAVVTGLSLTGQPVPDRLGSMSDIILADRDFAVAISRDYIMSLIEPMLDNLRKQQLSFTMSVKMPVLKIGPIKLGGGNLVSGTYMVTITTATAAWSTGTMTLFGTQLPAGLISLEIGGSARTGSILPNASFAVKHSLWLVFYPPTETLFLLQNGSPAVTADVNGPLAPLVTGEVRTRAANIYNQQLGTVLVQTAPVLQGAVARKQELISQLQTLDDQANARFDAAEFTPDGAILRGVISLSPRRLLEVNPARLADRSGFTGLLSWIPGGRIDRFEWSWSWFPASQSGPYGPGGPHQFTQAHADRFLLRAAVSLPGLPPLPGTPEYPVAKLAGAVCLTIIGRRVNPVNGDDEPVQSNLVLVRTPNCLHFQPDPPLPVWSDEEYFRKERLYLKVWRADASGSSAASREVAVVEIKAGGSSTSPHATLMYYLNEIPDEAALAPLNEALRAVVTEEVSLLVVILLREGLLEAGGRALGETLARALQESPAPVLVNEDVRGGWSARTGLATEGRHAALRLLTADGRIAWSHEGAPDAEALAAVLREHLLPDQLPGFDPIELGVRIGERAPNVVLDTGHGTPLHIRHLRGRPVVLCFVQPWADSSRAQLRRLERLAGQLDREGAMALVIVDGAAERAAAELAERHGSSFLTVADPQGTITSRFGVRIWPTMVTVDQAGAIASITMGTDQGALDLLARDETS